MSRNYLVSSIVVIATILAWFGYDELARARALVAQTNEIVKLPEFPGSIPASPVPVSTTPPEAADTALVTFAESSEGTTPPITNEAISISNENVASQPETLAATESQPETSEAVNESAANPTSDAAPVSCSSFDEAGLFAAFDGALAAFLSDASATYGSQYENLNYELSSKTGSITGEQGTVSTNYSGTVKELSTGQDVSANGTITATFNWDGCAWQLLDYSF